MLLLTSIAFTATLHDDDDVMMMILFDMLIDNFFSFSSIRLSFPYALSYCVR